MDGSFRGWAVGPRRAGAASSYGPSEGDQLPRLGLSESGKPGVHRLNDDRSLSDSGGDPFHGAQAHVTDSEDPGQLARHLKKQSPLTLRYTRMALSTRFRRRLQEELSYGLALEGISAAQVAALNAQKAEGRG